MNAPFAFGPSPVLSAFASNINLLMMSMESRALAIQSNQQSLMAETCNSHAFSALDGIVAQDEVAQMDSRDRLRDMFEAIGINPDKLAEWLA